MSPGRPTDSALTTSYPQGTGFSRSLTSSSEEKDFPPPVSDEEDSFAVGEPAAPTVLPTMPSRGTRSGRGRLRSEGRTSSRRLCIKPRQDPPSRPARGRCPKPSPRRTGGEPSRRRRVTAPSSRLRRPHSWKRSVFPSSERSTRKREVEPGEGRDSAASPRKDARDEGAPGRGVDEHACPPRETSSTRLDAGVLGQETQPAGERHGARELRRPPVSRRREPDLAVHPATTRDLRRRTSLSTEHGRDRNARRPITDLIVSSAIGWSTNATWSAACLPPGAIRCGWRIRRGRFPMRKLEPPPRSPTVWATARSVPSGAQSASVDVVHDVTWRAARHRHASESPRRNSQGRSLTVPRRITASSPCERDREQMSERRQIQGLRLGTSGASGVDAARPLRRRRPRTRRSGSRARIARRLITPRRNVSCW